MKIEKQNQPNYPAIAEFVKKVKNKKKEVKAPKFTLMNQNQNDS